MISYPGDIQARFGRYEGVERLGALERGELWRAWDPFLERFVAVAALSGMDAAEIHDLAPRLEAELARWLGGWHRAGMRVFDFGPGGPEDTAFFVVDLPRDPSEPGTFSAGHSTRESAQTGSRPRGLWLGLLAGGLGLLAGTVFWLSAQHR
jgi:hypothetical protein